MEKIVKLQRFDTSAKDEEGCNEYLDSMNRHPSSSAMSLDVSCENARTFKTKCSLSSSSNVNAVGDHLTQKSVTQSSKSGSVVIRKIAKHTISGRQHESHSGKIRNRCNVVKDVENEVDQGCSSNPMRLSRDVFIIESFSSSSEDNHPDWKAPLPPSMYLRKNRPELIRRIENRQAAIRAAATLRHRVAEEKMKAARDVVQRKCTVNSVRKSLMLDPTRITAFPKSEMVNLSRRRLRASCAYKTEVLGGRSRIDIAASKIIAHTFSEATRQAILARR
ncbi:unnamed protein product [Angiostrongylus costaricensis]|uniref:TPX2 domain-containing protein n=1 Tax=Angiostrongylus costaricensis TaxID=334426 RepID=A0A158PGX2_ANGCS|nr:unnamed protein product [Angiostrongylus costaricensis]